MARALNANEFLNKKFKCLEFTGNWLQAFGEPEKNFNMIIFGKSGNGKTEFSVMLAKYLTKFGKVLYNSYEQGYTRSLQDAWRRNAMHEVSRNILVTHRESYAEMVCRLEKKKSPSIVFIDSIQYIRMSYEQYQHLRNQFPRKIFIVISHAKGDDPKGVAAESIQYDCEIKVLVKGFKAWPDSRYGGNQPYCFYPEGHARWLEKKQKTKPQSKEITPQNENNNH